MSSFTDAFNSMTVQLSERFSSPLMGGFLISWLLWNYRLVFVLFSGMDIELKFDYIDEFHFDSWYRLILQGFIYPLITSLIFIYLYPWPALKTFEYYRKKQKLLRDKKLEIENSELLTVEQSVSLRLEISSLKEKFHNELSEKDKIIESQKSEIESNRLLVEDRTRRAEELKIEANKFKVESEKLKDKIDDLYKNDASGSANLLQKGFETGFILEPEEESLLKFASQDKKGEIHILHSDTGIKVIAGGNVIYEGDERELITKYESVVETLFAKGLVEHHSGNGDLYVLTNDAYIYLKKINEPKSKK